MKRILCKIAIIFIVGLFCDVSIIFARDYNVNSSNIEAELDCWVGWKDWHFGVTNPITKKGDIVRYVSRVIIDGEYVPVTSEVTTNGYGYYSLNFKKHMLGFLYYILDKIADYPTSYIPYYDQPEFDQTTGEIIEPQPLTMRNAVQITISKLLRSSYDNSYEYNEFLSFWNNAIKLGDVEDLRKLQNGFYWRAYGDAAFEVLTRMMGSTYTSLSTQQKQILKGVLFSVMEAKYRNKDLQGKSDLRLKAAEGELYPFLVNLKNLEHIVRIDNNGYYTYKDTRLGYAYYEFPTFDELIDGAYQWMEYYDKDTINSTTHATITSQAREGSEEVEVEADWEAEYYNLTNTSLTKLKGKDLEKFYDRCYQVRNIFKKSKENAEGIFGAEELYDITSDINFSQALENMKTAMDKFCGDAGDYSKVWVGLTDYNIERTYMMAKNIVESNRVQDEYAYYDIGTNIITYTPGLMGSEYMLVDLQKIKLNAPLETINHGRVEQTEEDTDDDGILDRAELGDASSEEGTATKVKVDITGFIKKAIEKELYGNNEKEINKNQTYVKQVLAQVKFNIYNNRNKFDKENIDNNKFNWKEVYENNLNIDDETRQALNILPNETAQMQYIKSVPSKLEVELWKYKSNPVLKDTDFDGIDDGFGYERDEKGEYIYNSGDKKIAIDKNKYKDKKPKDNHFIGRLNSTRISGEDSIETDMTMDYRYFFLSNKLYYDELSTMSLLYSNSIYRQDSGIEVKNDNNKNNHGTYDNLKVKDLMEFYGFKDVRTYYIGTEDDDGYEEGDICRNYHRDDTHKGRLAIGYRNLEYHGLYKTVIGIIIRGTAEDDDWDTDFDIGDLELKNALKEKTVVKAGYNDNKIDSLNNSTKNSRIIDLYFDHNQVLDYDKKYYNELKHFAYGYPDWTKDQHHAGFDIVSNRMLEIINEYYHEVYEHFDDDINVYDDGKDYNYVDGGVCFWVTGHSMGGGVTNLVGAKLVDAGYKDNVYCYTYAAPNTFYITDNKEGNYKEPKGTRYRCIFNIVNEDDFVPEVPMNKCGWTKYGRTAILSFNSSIKEIEKIINNTSKNNTTHLNLSNTKKFIYETYNGNKQTIKDIIDSFNGIFEDNSDYMRYSTYTFDDNTYIIITKAPSVVEDSMPRFVKPYQKIVKQEDKFYFNEYQMPAYFMQYISYCMHEKDNNGNKVFEIPGIANLNQIKFVMSIFNTRYKKAQERLRDAAIYKLIETPHYLESYYCLTKKININDFK